MMGNQYFMVKAETREGKITKTFHCGDEYPTIPAIDQARKNALAISKGEKYVKVEIYSANNKKYKFVKDGKTCPGSEDWLFYEKVK